MPTRRIRLQVREDICGVELYEMYRKQIGGLLSSWNWGEDDLF